ncbi:MAG: FAD-dependent monooxygenase [Paracoccaceae bacterium]
MLIGQEITVIGAGIGGLACALALAGFGAQVRVLEQADAVTEVGAGLQISPNGVAVLDGLGLGDAARGLAVAAQAVCLRDYQAGALVLRLDLARYAKGQDFLLLHRADLIGLLYETALARGIKVELGRTVVAGEIDGLVIGADGLHSVVRRSLNAESEPFFTGQVAWRALVEATGDVVPEVNVFMGPGRHLVTYPLRGSSLINIVAVEERAEWVPEGWNEPGDPVDLRRAFAGFSPEMQHLLDRVEQVNLWGLFRHPVAKNWTGKQSAILGDAAHPTLPFLAQGANLALEDAWVLADCLAKMATPAALKTYQLRRKGRAIKVITAANANARNYHLSNPLMRGAAHALLRGVGALAPARVVSQFDWIYTHDVTAT